MEPSPLAWQVAPGVGAQPPPDPTALLEELKLDGDGLAALRETVSGFLAEEMSQG